MLRICGFTIIICSTAISAFDWGLDATACEFFTPSHVGRNRRPSPTYYNLWANKMLFSPGEQIKRSYFSVKVLGEKSSDSYAYKGILMAVMYDNVAVGQWNPSIDFRAIHCDLKFQSAIAEYDEYAKRVGKDFFIWTAPSTCTFDKTYYIKATVVKSKREFLDEMYLPLKCVHPPKQASNDSCARGFYYIPDSASTSFENRTLGGWRNSNDSQLNWLPHTGATKSPGTGPENAYDGEYYTYVEASYPALYGYQAVLISPPGLAGCFCFRYSYHMFTDPNVEFFCTINDKRLEGQHKNFLPRDQQDVSAMSNSKRSKWIRTWLSVNEPGNVTIEIHVIRGSTFRGDVALDHFALSPGKCDEDVL